MKNFYNISLYAILFLLSINCLSQVGIGTTTPDASSALDITSTTAGLLAPRMTQAQKTAIATPATGLLIYQTDGTAGFYYYNGSAWMPFGSSGWALTGNAGTAPATNFLGTTDAQDLVIKANNTEAIRVKNGGNVGIGNSSPTTKLHATGTTIPTVAGGVSTLFTNDFSTGSVTSVSAGGNTCVATPNIWYVAATSSNASCNTCTGNRAYIQYSTSCTQNQTFSTNSFTPTTTSIAISFNYGYDYLSGDSFTVTLYNTTTNTVAFTLLNLTADALNATFSSTRAVTVGNTYVLKFNYTGNNAWGAAVDNILVTETITPVAGSYVFRLEDGTQSAGKVLTSDASGNASWATPSSASSYTFTNGLNNTAGTVKLGGTLTESTNINASSFPLTISTTNKTDLFRVNNTDEIVYIGDYTAPTADGNAYSLNNFNGNIEFISKMSTSGTRGTGMGMGSIEYLIDGESVIASSVSILPLTDNTLTLGTSYNRWNTVYSVNGTLSTSDAALKKDINLLNYGLKEILALKPVTFKWKDEFTSSNQKVTDDKKSTKIGFLAQELLKVIPEVVQTHSWQITDEKKPAEYLPNKNLGVFYSDLIPVAVKAIQEQQTQIEELKKAVEELKKQNELLLQLVSKK